MPGVLHAHLGLPAAQSCAEFHTQPAGKSIHQQVDLLTPKSAGSVLRGQGLKNICGIRWIDKDRGVLLPASREQSRKREPGNQLLTTQVGAEVFFQAGNNGINQLVHFLIFQGTFRVLQC